MNEAAKALYREVILEHSARPKNEGVVEPCTHSARGTNALCGDRIDITLRLVDGVIDEVRFASRGCNILRASASILTERVHRRPAAQARELARRFVELVQQDEGQAEDLALDALLGVRQFPTRRRCATLPWSALTDALANPNPE